MLTAFTGWPRTKALPDNLKGKRSPARKRTRSQLSAPKFELVNMLSTNQPVLILLATRGAHAAPGHPAAAPPLPSRAKA